jgi:hypothetical protein
MTTMQHADCASNRGVLRSLFLFPGIKTLLC